MVVSTNHTMVKSQPVLCSVLKNARHKAGGRLEPNAGILAVVSTNHRCYKNLRLTLPRPR